MLFKGREIEDKPSHFMILFPYNRTLSILGHEVPSFGWLAADQQQRQHPLE